ATLTLEQQQAAASAGQIALSQAWSASLARHDIVAGQILITPNITEEPIVGMMTEWTKGNEKETRSAEGDLGGTMRLGAYPAQLTRGSRVADIYGATRITERHRHRYEVNMEYRKVLEKNGLLFSGVSPDGTLPEIVERTDHPWFIGVQFHPELKSKPFEPHPLFASFIAAAMEQSRLV